MSSQPFDPVVGPGAEPLPLCDCDIYMPPGQHDPYVHAAQERAAIEAANEALEDHVEEDAEEAGISTQLYVAAGRCQCHKHMPSGQHDPLNHSEGDRAAISEANQLVATARTPQPGSSDSNTWNLGRRYRKKNAFDLLWKVRGAWAKQMRRTPAAKSLAQTLAAKDAKATFTCGGSIAITPNGKGKEKAAIPITTGPGVIKQKVGVKPISLRWGNDGHGHLLTLPQHADSACFNQLVQDCIPATFGRGGEDVHDAEYRRAGALSPREFMTDFCPYEAGIIDVVTQLLLPASSFTGHGNSIRAELYKLNVYSGPSGFFKPHVDTPRSSHQIGSLVVCLPVGFEGGALVVRHQGNEVVHDWSSKQMDRQSSIRWAAFYSDCEHEVLEVTAGHRVTLTYNLFLAASSGSARATILQPELLPLTRQLKSCLDDHEMWPHGGYTGIHMAHSYPHTHAEAFKCIPQMLKATDMAVYEAVQTLRLTGILTPGYPDHLHNVLCDLDAQHEQRRPVGQHGNTIRNELEPLHLATGRDDMVWDPICEDDEELQTSSDSDEDAQWGSPGERYYEYLAEKRAAMGANRQICWPNDFGHTELSKAYLVHGNNAELEVKYSSIALVVKIPSWSERCEAKLGSKDEPMIVE